jgi:hypothetical protein
MGKPCVSALRGVRRSIADFIERMMYEVAAADWVAAVAVGMMDRASWRQ